MEPRSLLPVSFGNPSDYVAIGVVASPSTIPALFRKIVCSALCSLCGLLLKHPQDHPCPSVFIRGFNRGLPLPRSRCFRVFGVFRGSQPPPKLISTSLCGLDRQA